MVTYGIAWLSIWLLAMSAFLFPKGVCACFISLTACHVFIIFDCMWFACIRGTSPELFFFCHRAFQYSRFFLSDRLKHGPFSPFITTVMCLSCACVLRGSKQACPFTPIPAPSSSFTQPPLQCFHIDSSVHPAVAQGHRAAADRDKNQVYFPP